MKLITRDTDYSIRALAYMAKDKKNIIPASRLVTALKIPRPFLRKILQALEKKGLLRSYKGRGGGFLLARPARKIFLVDLIRIFQGNFRLNECFFKRNLCPHTKTCRLKERIDTLDKYVRKELESISIADLIS